MRFIDDTIMEKRPGIRIYEENAYPSLTEKISWLDVYNPTLSDPKIVRGTSTALYIGDEKISDVEGDVMGATYVGKYYFVDGKSLRVYNNDKCYKIVREPIVHATEDAKKDATTVIVDRLPEMAKVGDEVMILKASVGQEENFTTKIKEIKKNDAAEQTEEAEKDEKETYTITLEKGLTGDIIKTTPIFFYTPKDSKNVVGEEIWMMKNSLHTIFLVSWRLQMITQENLISLIALLLLQSIILAYLLQGTVRSLTAYTCLVPHNHFTFLPMQVSV